MSFYVYSVVDVSFYLSVVPNHSRANYVLDFPTNSLLHYHQSQTDIDTAVC